MQLEMFSTEMIDTSKININFGGKIREKSGIKYNGANNMKGLKCIHRLVICQLLLHS